MLKIKDDVNLKELEKFGFKRTRHIDTFSEDDWWRVELVQEKDGSIRKKTNEDKFPNEEVNWVTWDKGYFSINEFDRTNDEEKFESRQILDIDEDFDTLYDLIKSNLIEKVENKNE